MPGYRQENRGEGQDPNRTWVTDEHENVRPNVSSTRVPYVLGTLPPQVQCPSFNAALSLSGFSDVDQNLV
jgi:hypothetical protein